MKQLNPVLTACASMLLLIACIFTTQRAYGQDNLKIKDAAGNILLEARTDGIIVRKMTTVERAAVPGLDAGDNGLLVFDTDTKSLWLWHDTQWVEIDGVDLVDDADNDPTNELQTWNSLPGIPEGFADGTDHVDDADNDPTNELQTWNSLPGIPAGFADGTDHVDDADNDPTNELQTWNSLPGIPAGFADGTDHVDDADNDPTNELQTWNNLPGIPEGFADGTDHVDDADNDPANELQTWNSLPGIPAEFADGTDNVDDADNDPLNEKNTALTRNGNQLQLTDAGGTLDANIGWAVGTDKVFNEVDVVGIGTNEPQAGLHVRGSKGLGEYIMLVENSNHLGSGLKIKIDGSHPLFVNGEGNNPDFFVTHPGSTLLTVFDSVAGDITDYLLNHDFNLSEFSFSQIGQPGGIISQLGLDEFMAGGICKGAQTLVEMFNELGLESINLPDLPLDDIPQDLTDMPELPEIPSPPNPISINIPDPTVCISLLNIGCWSVPIPAFNLSTSFISNPINTFNTGISNVNTGIGTVNTVLENGYDKVKDGLTILDGLEIPLPQLPIPQNIGPITCPNPNPWDAFNLSFQALNPNDYSIANPLSKQNEFITFVDQFDNKLGAVTGMNMGEHTLDYFKVEKVLKIGGHIFGLFSDDGNIGKNALNLVKEAIEFYKATDKLGVSYSSGHGDYAEWLERENHAEELGYGDIVGVRGGKISLSLENAEQIMVISKAPIVLGNAPEPGNEGNGNNVAFIGQVPVKVMGPVKTGDYIIANPEMPGYGIAVSENELTEQQLSLAVGRSWETNETPGFKYVNTIVGMHDAGWAVPVMKLRDQLNLHETAIQQLTARLDNMEHVNSVSSSAKRSR